LEGVAGGNTVLLQTTGGNTVLLQTTGGNTVLLQTTGGKDEQNMFISGGGVWQANQYFIFFFTSPTPCCDVHYYDFLIKTCSARLYLHTTIWLKY
jgi:hypothetical protein